MSIQAARPDPLLPWSLGAAMTLLAANLLGLSLGLAAWYGSARESGLQGQMKWMSLAGTGCIILGLGSAVFLLVGRRTIGQGIRLLADADAVGCTLAGDEGTALEDGAFVVVPGLAHFHRPECLLVKKRPAEAATRVECEQAALMPCGFCEP